MTLNEWAIRHGVTSEALAELAQCANVKSISGASESNVQSQVQLEAAQLGIRLWRNNSGALKDSNGRLIRYGLGHVSAESVALFKSPDLVGLRTIIATEGQRVAQFVARECKKGGWKYKGTEAEKAQLRFITLINEAGGDAAFVTGTGGF